MGNKLFCLLYQISFPGICPMQLGQSNSRSSALDETQLHYGSTQGTIWGTKHLTQKANTEHSLCVKYCPGVRVYHKQFTLSSQRDASPMNLQTVYEIAVKINQEMFLSSCAQLDPAPSPEIYVSGF